MSNDELLNSLQQMIDAAGMTQSQRLLWILILMGILHLGKMWPSVLYIPQRKGRHLKRILHLNERSALCKGQGSSSRLLWGEGRSASDHMCQSAWYNPDACLPRNGSLSNLWVVIPGTLRVSPWWTVARHWTLTRVNGWRMSCSGHLETKNREALRELLPDKWAKQTN